MKTWMHPELGEVGELRPKQSPLKTWNHLLKASENWTVLTGVAHADLSNRARAAGCPNWRRVKKVAWLAPCTDCLRQVHDQHWRATYGRELVTTTKLGRQLHRAKRWTLASPQGCIIIVDRGQIISVYRPHPEGLTVPFSEQDFRDQCDHVLRKDTGARAMTPQEAQRRPLDSPTALWHVALALSHAEATGAWSAEECGAVRERIATVPAAVKAILLPDAALFDALEAAQDEPEADELEPLVDTVADWLAVVERVHGNTAAQDVLEQSADIVALAPAAWLALQPLVDERRAQAKGMAAAWWEELDELLGALRLAEVPAVHAAPSMLAAKVAAREDVPSLLATLWSTLSSLGQRLGQPAQPNLVERVATELSNGQAVDVKVTGPLPSGVRVFVVDGDHPRGEELTADWPLGSIWELDHPGDETWLVTVSGNVAGASLAEVIEAAAAAPEARVEVAPLHRR